MRIIPSILTSDPVEVKEKITACEGVAERVQIDIVDGVFSDNKTIDPSVLESIDTVVYLDFHLMTKEPVNWIERSVRAGAERIIGQIELMSSQSEFVGKVVEAGLKAGLAIDIDTDISAIDKSIINDLDLLLIMSVKAGFGGQEYDSRAIEKIKKLDAVRAKDVSPFTICDDGGITLSKIRELKILGVDEVIIGKRLFDGDLRENIDKYVKAAGGVL